MAGRKSNGNGGGPPEELPPEQPAPEPGDDDNQRFLLEWIRGIVRAERDQDMAAITKQFDQVAEAMNQMAEAIKGKFEETAQAINRIVQAQEGQRSRRGLSEAEGPGQDLAVSEDQWAEGNGSGFNFRRALGMAVYRLLDNPGEFGESVGALFNGFAQARAAFRPPDTDVVLRHIAATEPQKLLAYVPDPLGGRFPELMSNAIQTGVRIGASGRYDSGPLGGPWGGASGGPSGPPGPPAGSGGSSFSTESLTDQEIDAAVAQLMRVKMARGGSGPAR